MIYNHTTRAPEAIPSPVFPSTYPVSTH